MEILYQHQDMFGRYLFMSIGILLTLLFTIGFIWMLIDYIKEKDEELIGGTITLGLLSVVLITLTLLIITKDPKTVYKAYVTDFNEVYEQGYKIVGQEGKIYLLEKDDE